MEDIHEKRLEFNTYIKFLLLQIETNYGALIRLIPILNFYYCRYGFSHTDKGLFNTYIKFLLLQISSIIRYMALCLIPILNFYYCRYDAIMPNLVCLISTLNCHCSKYNYPNFLANIFCIVFAMTEVLKSYIQHPSGTHAR